MADAGTVLKRQADEKRQKNEQQPTRNGRRKKEREEAIEAAKWHTWRITP